MLARGFASEDERASRAGLRVKAPNLSKGARFWEVCLPTTSWQLLFCFLFAGQHVATTVESDAAFPCRRLGESIGGVASGSMMIARGGIVVPRLHYTPVSNGHKVSQQEWLLFLRRIWVTMVTKRKIGVSVIGQNFRMPMVHPGGAIQMPESCKQILASLCKGYALSNNGIWKWTFWGLPERKVLPSVSVGGMVRPQVLLRKGAVT